jgi:cysteinyl-tRNA synthetase
MYVCGPTVYDDPHLGHAKSYISFDVVVRFLRAQGYKVRYVQNITDVGHLLGDDQSGEDRVEKKAKVENLEPVEIAQKYEIHFFRDMDRLNCLRPDISCRASGHIPEMIELIERLIEKGFGYTAGGNVYYPVSKFKKYGRLSGRKIDELIEGVRVESAKDKKNSADFALWKEADPAHLMQWPSPWGRGYPGWHLECSVMSMKYLGESFDIHGGGIDNQFPHHECEIAQSEAATGKPFAKYWLHNNMVTVNGQKMSKSLGNFITVDTLLIKYNPMTVRLFILQGHYRSPQDFSDQALVSAQKGFERLAKTVNDLRAASGGMPQNPVSMEGRWLAYRQRFIEFMEDDFNTSGGVSVLFDLVKEANDMLSNPGDPKERQILEWLFTELAEGMLGFRFDVPSERDRGAGLESMLIEYLLKLRNEFRQEKEWKKADEIRDTLDGMGITFEDTKKGTKWRKK